MHFYSYYGLTSKGDKFSISIYDLAQKLARDRQSVRDGKSFVSDTGENEQFYCQKNQSVANCVYFLCKHKVLIICTDSANCAFNLPIRSKY